MKIDRMSSKSAVLQALQDLSLFMRPGTTWFRVRAEMIDFENRRCGDRKLDDAHLIAILVKSGLVVPALSPVKAVRIE